MKNVRSIGPWETKSGHSHGSEEGGGRGGISEREGGIEIMKMKKEREEICERGGAGKIR